MGRVHAEAARRAGARVVGVVASSPARSTEAAASLGADQAFPYPAELVAAPEVEVVHICTPNDTHVPLALAALDAGKHVVCEKPIATAANDAARLAARARQAAVVAAVPFVYRYHPMATEARARVGSGAAGAIRVIHGSYLQDWLASEADTNWRVDADRGGPSRAFADIGSHWCDLVEWTSGHRVRELVALTATMVGERPVPSAITFAATERGGATVPVTTEDVAALLFRTNRGAVGTLLVSQVSPGRNNRLWFEIDGSLASVVFDQEQPEELWIGRRGGVELLRRDPAVLSPDAARLATLPAGHPQGYHDCFTGFLADVYAAIRGEPRPGLPTFDDAARTAVLTEAVLESARSHSWIEVPP
jgi:predicted dehydrogenase